MRQDEPDATTARGASRDAEAAAGALLFLVGGVALLGIITAEVLYPGYTTLQEISDLGASRPPNSVIYQPSASIFNATMLVSGALVLAGTFFAHRSLERRAVTVPLALFGAGIFGVGFFPGNVVPWHGLFALLTFVSGGFSAVLSARVVEGPFQYLCVAFGAFSLAVLASVFVLGESNPLLVLGLGGVERLVVYPILVWVTGFGGYLLGQASAPAQP
ncbi:DUF998 domain-containing protein [Halobacterium wangiae]|uniref:DUF998 domain-containing protein n=1 Tax=Halobacterium wangiae TaxID=2902623 RepID=UPI001E5A0830|nr:DUF998 domain-containing protein [Halobacterium wangiae]